MNESIEEHITAATVCICILCGVYLSINVVEMAECTADNKEPEMEGPPAATTFLTATKTRLYLLDPQREECLKDG